MLNQYEFLWIGNVNTFVLDKEIMEANERTIKSKFRPISRGELECLQEINVEPQGNNKGTKCDTRSLEKNNLECIQVTC